MHEAVNNGLDLAIVNYTKIYPLYKIPEAEVELARKADLSGLRSNGDPLQNYMASLLPGRRRRRRGASAEVEALSVEDKLKYLIINGEKAIGDEGNRSRWKRCWRTRCRHIRHLI